MRAPRPLACSTLALTLVLTLATAAAAHSQSPQQALQLEGRLDAIVAHTTGVEAGLGLSVPAGIYVRSGLVAGIGAGRHGLEGRTDVLARFSLDPFRQSRWAPYGGAGVSGRYRSKFDGGSRAYLLVLIGVEGPLRPDRMSGIVPAFEVGLGGGARFGVILRRGVNARR
jgi:hypothetical protein